jgi:hypothetical protein
LRPRFGVSAYRVGRIDIQQEINEIADIERGHPDIGACAIGTHPNLQPIWTARQFHCTRIESHATAVLQAYFRR